MIKMIIEEYKEMKKRGQVSFFVILGIVFLIVIGFVIYLASFSTKERSKREVITTQQMPTDIQEINNYVISCLGKTFEDGLVRIGKEGGRIFAPWGPSLSHSGTEGEDYLNLIGLPGIDDGEVPYLITTPESYSVFSINPPDYPWAPPHASYYFPYKNVAGNTKFDAEIFGHSDLPILKKEDNPDQATASFEYQLEYYINENLADCIDFTRFKEFTITDGTETSTVEVTDIDVKVSLIYPLNIIVKTTGEERKLREFYINPRINLKDFYGKVRGFISDEAEKINNDLPKSNGGVTISADYENAYNKDDLIKITSPDLIEGKVYEFRFMRKNRRPALLYIPDQEVDEGDLLTINPNVIDIYDNGFTKMALDPDEDSLEYSLATNEPSGMSIDAATGTISWQTNDDTDNEDDTYNIEVHVTDAELEDYQSVDIVVKDDE